MTRAKHAEGFLSASSSALRPRPHGPTLRRLFLALAGGVLHTVIENRLERSQADVLVRLLAQFALDIVTQHRKRVGASRDALRVGGADLVGPAAALFTPEALDICRHTGFVCGESGTLVGRRLELGADVLCTERHLLLSAVGEHLADHQPPDHGRVLQVTQTSRHQRHLAGLVQHQRKVPYTQVVRQERDLSRLLAHHSCICASVEIGAGSRDRPRRCAVWARHVESQIGGEEKRQRREPERKGWRVEWRRWLKKEREHNFCDVIERHSCGRSPCRRMLDGLLGQQLIKMNRDSDVASRLLKIPEVFSAGLVL